MNILLFVALGIVGIAFQSLNILLNLVFENKKKTDKSECVSEENAVKGYSIDDLQIS